MSRTKATFSHLRLSDFEGSLPRKLRFHIWHRHFLKEVSHERCVFTSSTFIFLREVSNESFVFTSSTVIFARKLRFPIFHFQFLAEISHEMRFGAAISNVLARSSFVLCKSVSADHTVMDASRLIGVAASRLR